MISLNTNDLYRWFSRVQQVLEQQRTIAAITGENFNVFRVLGVESSEVRLHSAFLSEFLNPNGSHGQGDIYLKLFVDQLNISGFDTKSANSEVEKSVGQVDEEYNTGGRIDISITDKNNMQINIENKIYASDQKNQLLRYYNYNNDAYLFYLTLDGTDPSTDSVGHKLHDNFYRKISYKSDVIEWLEKCRKESVGLPIIRETITQYICSLRILTCQTGSDFVSHEIIKFIQNNPEFVESIEVCSNALNTIVDAANNAFVDRMDLEFEKRKTVKVLNDVEIICEWGEDGDGVHFGYVAYKNTNVVSGTSDCVKYIDVLKSINSNFQSGQYWLGWINPKAFKRYVKFKMLPKAKILDMYNNHVIIDELVRSIVNDEDEIRQKFLSMIGN